MPAPTQTPEPATPPRGVPISELQKRASTLNRLPTSVTGAPQFVGLMAKILLGVIGSLTLLFYIYAGFLWMTAMGNSEKTEQSRKIFVWTTLGVVVILGSYMLVDMLFSALNLK